MLNRLSDIDAVALRGASSTVPGHTVALIILEASEQLGRQRLHELIGLSLPQLTRCRSRIVRGPLGFGQPMWAEIDDYDPNPQIHNATVAAPGGAEQLAELIAILTAGSLDRNKPAWAAWCIDGLRDGRWALALKMGPAVGSGVAGVASVWPQLLTSRPQQHLTGYGPAEPSPGERPSISELMIDAIAECVRRHVIGGWLIAGALPDVMHAVLDRAQGTVWSSQLPNTASSMRGPVPRTAFNMPLTPRRAVAFESLSLGQLKTVRRAFGGSINNVLLAACTLSLRAWLQRHGAVPADPLLMQIPLPRPGCDSSIGDDRLMFGRIRLPVQLEDPVQILTDLHPATEALTADRQTSAEERCCTAHLPAVMALIPSNFVTVGKRLATGLGLSHRLTSAVHGTISHLTGPPTPVYCAGVNVAAIHTAEPLVDGAGLNITMISHGDVLNVSVCVCPDNVPAVNEIATGIVRGVGILVAAAEEFPRGVGPSVLTDMTSHAKTRQAAMS